MSTLSINFHKLAKFVNFIIPISAIAFFLAGIFVSFYFHFLSIAFIFLTVINYFYLNVQTQHSILRNFGMVGQLRYMLESLGPELRQYLFSSDTEEKPFNREERSEVYRKSKGVDSALSFGSQNLFDSSEIKFRHSLFPVEKNKIEPYKITFGEERGIKNTYTINKHIMISAMSFGALGEKAIYSLARGAKMAKIPMNTGEGGYPKHHLTEGCDLIFQLGTAKFGARHLDGTLDQEKLKHISQNPEVKMIEIKLSQGAKPGKGGLLLKEKITDEISELRGVSKDHDIVSPMYHRECQDLESMVQFINNIQEISQLPVGIKICIGLEDEFRAMIQEMKKQDVFPDYIAIDGAEGGTGAAPKAYMDHFGLPLFSALKIVQKILIEEQSRGRVKIIASGKLINIGKQMMALSLGADVIYSARGFMLALGCIQALQC
ncbi:Ferredoxin-dependent glutamate synthase, partial [hydrothermal vent metagenome]